MILTLSISISILVAINFLLLKFSCNKTPKKVQTNKKPILFNPQVNFVEESQILAPTGS